MLPSVCYCVNKDCDVKEIKSQRNKGFMYKTIFLLSYFN